MIVPDGATTPVYGIVSSVGLIASTTSGVATYPVTIAVTGNPGGLYPGASATVTLIVKQLSNVTTVPTAALHYTSSGAEVYEMVNGHQVAYPVTVGMTSVGETQIISGLSVGTKVVVQGLARHRRRRDDRRDRPRHSRRLRRRRRRVRRGRWRRVRRRRRRGRRRLRWRRVRGGPDHDRGGTRCP